MECRSGGSTPSVTSTLYHKLLADIPAEDYNYLLVMDMINNNMDLFDIIMPICPDVLGELLSSHPNCRFVELILCGFCEGFWPSALAEHLVCRYEGHDNHQANETLDENSLVFMHTQHDTEIGFNRYSQSFGLTLLPGMVSQPCFPVPKPGSATFQLVNDNTTCHGMTSLPSFSISDSIQPCPLTL